MSGLRGAPDPHRTGLQQSADRAEEQGRAAAGRAPVRPHHQVRRREADQLPRHDLRQGGEGAQP